MIPAAGANFGARERPGEPDAAGFGAEEVERFDIATVADNLAVVALSSADPPTTVV